MLPFLVPPIVLVQEFFTAFGFRFKANSTSEIEKSIPPNCANVRPASNKKKPTRLLSYRGTEFEKRKDIHPRQTCKKPTIKSDKSTGTPSPAAPSQISISREE